MVILVDNFLCSLFKRKAIEMYDRIEADDAKTAEVSEARCQRKMVIHILGIFYVGSKNHRSG